MSRKLNQFAVNRLIEVLMVPEVTIGKKNSNMYPCSFLQWEVICKHVVEKVETSVSNAELTSETKLSSGTGQKAQVVAPVTGAGIGKTVLRGGSRTYRSKRKEGQKLKPHKWKRRGKKKRRSEVKEVRRLAVMHTLLDEISATLGRAARSQAWGMSEAWNKSTDEQKRFLKERIQADLKGNRVSVVVGKNHSPATVDTRSFVTLLSRQRVTGWNVHVKKPRILPAYLWYEFIVAE